MGLVAAGLGFSLVALGQGSDTVEAPSCLRVDKRAPYRGLGYHHIVSLANRCDVDLTCRVSTNATPEAQEVDVDAGAHREVVTRIGSPARAFTATVRCEEK